MSGYFVSDLKLCTTCDRSQLQALAKELHNLQAQAFRLLGPSRPQTCADRDRMQPSQLESFAARLHTIWYVGRSSVCLVASTRLLQALLP